MRRSQTRTKRHKTLQSDAFQYHVSVHVSNYCVRMSHTKCSVATEFPFKQRRHNTKKKPMKAIHDEKEYKQPPDQVSDQGTSDRLLLL